MARDPQKPRRRLRNPVRQLADVHRQVRQIDPQITRWMLIAFAVTALPVAALGWLLGHPWIGLLWGIMLGVITAVIVLGRRGEKAAYGQLDGKPGATAAGLQSLRKGWYTSQEPVAADAQRGADYTDAALVFRALGRPGIVLLAEGPKARADKLLAKETKKVTRVAPGVPIHTYYVGNGEGALPVKKISRTLVKLRPVLSEQEMAAVNKRLKSMPTLRQAVPAGIDPAKARMNRKALRGR